jgi:hypothetical protein
MYGVETKNIVKQTELMRQEKGVPNVDNDNDDENENDVD